jgi:hypothetical protein
MTTPHRFPLAIAALAAGALFGATACSAPTERPSSASATADGSADEQALVTAGFETTAAESDPAATAPEASASASPKEHRPGLARRTLRKNTLHGELTVQTKQGAKTVLVQRGTITVVTATGLTVKSADGFTEQWLFGDKVRVRVDKKKAQVSDLKTGAEVGIAGAKSGADATARLLIVR